MCFPSFPQWKLTRPWFWDREHVTMVELARETPPRMARVVGVPCAMPSHVGDVTMKTPFARAVDWPTILLGETQICDAHGTTLARLSYEDGEGYVCADVDWVAPVDVVPENPVPPRFWMPVLPWTVHAVWYACNAGGRAQYRWRERRGGHWWQQDGREHPDLPDCVPAGMLPDAVSVEATGAGARTSVAR